MDTSNIIYQGFYLFQDCQTCPEISFKHPHTWSNGYWQRSGRRANCLLILRNKWTHNSVINSDLLHNVESLLSMFAPGISTIFKYE